MPPSYIRVRAVVWAYGRGQTDRHTQTRVTTIHFASSTTHAKCNKTKIMISGERQKPLQKAARWPCGVCGIGVGNDSIQCRPTSCHKWLHKKCSGIKGSM